MNRNIVLYINGKYTNERDYAKAHMMASRIEVAGYNAIVPCIKFGRIFLVDRCDAVFNLNDWELSEDAREIDAHARLQNTPVLRHISDLDHMEIFDPLQELRDDLGVDDE